MNGTVVEVPQPAFPTPIPSSDDDAPFSLPAEKRKRDEEGELKDIVIRPYPESIYDKPFLLKPLRVVSRSRLPLSFLETVSTKSCLPLNRLFAAYIEVLEREDEPRVVIASLEKEVGLYAIERVKPKVYALCRLCAWVQIGYIEDGSRMAYEHVTRAARPAMGRWWDVAVVDVEREEGRAEIKRAKLSMAPPEQQQEKATENDINVPAIEVHGTNSVEDTLPMPAVDAPRSDDEVFETLIRQYLEALYVSKTSLAFFVKGPLSRARNQFGSASTTQSPLSNLTTQLRAMLLTMTAVDKKYREKLPETIKGFPHQTLSDAEAEIAVTKKKRKSKKLPKLSREGFYGIEEDYCKKWWLNTESSGAKARPEETLEQLIRRRVGELRMRETLAQIVLILEIFALESLPDFKAASETQTEQVVETQMETQVETQTETPAKTQVETQTDGPNTQRKTKTKRKLKKAVDIELLLDLLLDKLSIWQSIEAGIGTTDVEKKHDHTAENSEKLHEQDMLLSFCIDVVIPFYKSRIPKQASLVNKKLGGPGAISPAKAEKPKSRQPEKAAEKRVRRPLQKTLSETNGFTRSTRPPSLARSATDSQGIPRLKREASELSLFEIPAARPSHRDSLSQLKHLKQRQVDMHAISAATDARLKQKAKIEQDLKDAISTLKRPNRGQAVKELVDAADQRSLGSASMRKKTMGPIRKVLSNVRSVQVTATPKHKRGFNALEPRAEKDEPEKPAPSSGDFFIPSSGYRQPAAGVEMIGATPAMRRFTGRDMEHGVADTPSRKSLKSVFGDGVLNSSPPEVMAPAKSTIEKPGPKSSSFEEFIRSQLSTKRAPHTPMKKSNLSREKEASTAVARTPAHVFATPIKPALAKTQPAPTSAESDGLGGKSIYDALGWNDYDDDLA